MRPLWGTSGRDACVPPVPWSWLKRRSSVFSLPGYVVLRVWVMGLPTSRPGDRSKYWKQDVLDGPGRPLGDDHIRIGPEQEYRLEETAHTRWFTDRMGDCDTLGQELMPFPGRGHRTLEMNRFILRV